MNKILLFSLFVFSSAVFSASETLKLSPSRSGESVVLEEGYYQTYTTYESRTVSEYGCLPEQVVRPICSTLPPRNVCGPTPVCVPSRFGPGGQYCENRVVTENICRQRTRVVQVPVTRSRLAWETQAEIEVQVGEGFPEGNFDLTVDLTQDILTYSGLDYGSEYALLYEKLASDNPRRGEINEKVQISAIHASEYLAPITQIPALTSFDGRFLDFSVSELFNLDRVEIHLTLRNLQGQMISRLLSPSELYYRGGELEIDARIFNRPYFYPISGVIRISLKDGGSLLNAHQFPRRNVEAHFSLR